jgi:hypothetical protein
MVFWLRHLRGKERIGRSQSRMSGGVEWSNWSCEDREWVSVTVDPHDPNGMVFPLLRTGSGAVVQAAFGLFMVSMRSRIVPRSRFAI